jgi:NitT/TauT family transport system substrate-binding protein
MNKLIALVAMLLVALLSPLAARAADGIGNLAADAELVETKTESPKIKAAAPYEMKNGVVEIELSEYAGYSGLIAANGGLEPNDNSIFAKKHGFKVKITLSEEESWSALNSGKIGVSATTADVLAVYGKQFQVVVPAQIGFSRGADAVIVRSGIKRVNDLKGKVLAVAQFTEADFFIRYLAQEAGVGVNMLADLKAPPAADKINLVFTADAEGAANIFLRDLKANRNRLAGFVGWAPFTSEAVEKAEGKATLLASNRNLLVVADILIVNKGFATANPKIIAGLVEGLLEGNRMVRESADQHLDVIGKAFKWADKQETKAELAKVHLSNLPENLAFFGGEIDAAGSFNGIYQSAILAYGSELIPNPIDGEKFVDKKHLEALKAAGAFANQKIAIAPIKAAGEARPEGDPLLSKDIRFLFKPNSAELDLTNAENLKNLDVIKQLLQVSPGSTILLRGHVDNGMIPEFRKRGGEQLVRTQALRAMELSKKRAQEVKAVLASRNKLPEDRLDAVGRGWEEPLGNDSDQNRRVEVQWFTLE